MRNENARNNNCSRFEDVFDCLFYWRTGKNPKIWSRDRLIYFARLKVIWLLKWMYALNPTLKVWKKAELQISSFAATSEFAGRYFGLLCLLSWLLCVDFITFWNKRKNLVSTAFFWCTLLNASNSMRIRFLQEMTTPAIVLVLALCSVAFAVEKLNHGTQVLVLSIAHSLTLRMSDGAVFLLFFRLVLENKTSTSWSFPTFFDSLFCFSQLQPHKSSSPFQGSFNVGKASSPVVFFSSYPNTRKSTRKNAANIRRRWRSLQMHRSAKHRFSACNGVPQQHR